MQKLVWSGCEMETNKKLTIPNLYRRLLVVVLSISVVGVLSLAVSAAGGRFLDVDTNNLHADGIAWLADHGVTRGCNPEGTRFCPDAVT